jgi:hypothetical protein
MKGAATVVQCQTERHPTRITLSRFAARPNDKGADSVHVFVTRIERLAGRFEAGSDRVGGAADHLVLRNGTEDRKEGIDRRWSIKALDSI